MPVALVNWLNAMFLALATTDLGVRVIVRRSERIVDSCIFSVHIKHVTAFLDRWAHSHHKVRVVVQAHILWIREKFLRGVLVLILELAVSLSHLILLRSTASSTATIMAHGRVVVSANLTIAVAWTHHSQNFRESLAVLS